MSALFLPLLCLCSHRCYLSADSVAGTCWAFWRSSMSHARILVSSYCHIPTASMLSHLSRVQLFATLWTVAYQAFPSMGFSRQEYWSGMPLPSPNMQMTPLLCKKRRLKSLLMKVIVKSSLKAQHSENEDHGIWSHHFMGNRGK